MIFDPKALLTTLADHDVRYVLIGGLAATFHGSPVRTSDADICPARDAGNLARLSRALVDLDAKVFRPDPQAVCRSRETRRFWPASTC
ncbi:MAG: hypothetical protein Q7J25_03780 [Vicinamibacterales bacterium]|nr:hypothetical protein [Vicinamibacterales bacterium]